SAVYTIRNWPGKVSFVGREIGHTIHVGDALKNTPASNPVRRSYEIHRGTYNQEGHWNHHTADPTTLLYAVRGNRDYWDVEEGYIEINDDCTFEWKPANGARFKRLIQKMDRKQMGEMLEELIVRSKFMNKKMNR